MTAKLVSFSDVRIFFAAKYYASSASEVSDDRLELFEAGKSKAVQDEAESPVSEANGTVPEEAPSTLLSPMATVLSTAENALAASVSSLGAVALSVLPSSLTGPSEPPTDADKPITGESASPRMDLESMIDHDVPQIASLQESPADEEHQAADPADSSVHDETLDTASLEQEQEASTIDNSQEVKGVDAHIIGDILGPQDHEHSEEISEAVEQYKTGSLRDGASTTVDEVRNEELKQQDIPEQVEQGDLTEDSEGIRHDQAEDEVASDQVANDIASQTDLVESDNAAGEVAPPAEDPLPAHQASPVVDGEEHTVLQRPTELVEHNEGSVLREDDLTSRNQASKSSSEVRSQEASLEELVEESEAMPLAAEEDERAVNPVSEAAQSPTDVDQPNTSATDFRQGQEIKQSPDASIDSLPDVLLQHDVPMGQETSRDRESVDEDDAGPCKDDEEVEHDRMTRHTRPEGDTTAQDMFGHLATAEQAESTASITTSPISGLPIHVSQQIDKPLFGGHDAFHKNEAQEHMHDVQAAASASTVQPEAELDLPINNQEPRDMTIDAQTLAQHESAGTFEQATTFREYNFARAASDQEEAIPPTENADPILAITDPRPPPQDDQHEIDDFAENPERNRSDVAPAVVQRAAGDSDDANAGQMVFNTVQQEDIVEAPTNKASLIPEALLAEVEARKEKLHLEQHAEHPQEGDAISQDDAALDIASKAL